MESEVSPGPVKPPKSGSFTAVVKSVSTVRVVKTTHRVFGTGTKMEFQPANETEHAFWVCQQPSANLANREDILV
jgi:hypothetical protein